jgi:FAD dependent oxidoreductase
MIVESPAIRRALRAENIHADLIIIGGGLAGTCCAIAAARANINVVLMQDRPVLGGNASSEVRLWVLGATSYMGNNNRWARDGGVINQVLLENRYRNPDGNALLFDAILLEKVVSEKNIKLLLNTAVFEIEKKDADTIQPVKAFCTQNSIACTLTAPLFFDASGDGIVGFLAGAAFRMGAESKNEFGEKFALSKEYGELLGYSIYFYSKDTGKKQNKLRLLLQLTFQKKFSVTKALIQKTLAAVCGGLNMEAGWIQYIKLKPSNVACSVNYRSCLVFFPVLVS